ncbi:protein-export chaperone SecB [Moraxella osloensis]|jgi:preprotein translocase subunit SecB|uniref:Protein-export protein SecB n=1 Tax=Faucicola osloensis TaxID=34062 RepID=A0AAD0AF88_FAUOS|nr:MULTISPECIES: protein-export chaperone SecB [Pseudomonadota]EEV24137.1 protein-export chaperone SecB [Enhydrobacter aerosaccus SK60]NOX78722.1 protein-export chaperone SecB [Gammaproteobacteria bacterium]RVU83160.1 protein-export chaperone SecB [Leucothrix sargassi]TGP48579.1 protein-export chaperone SecB [bacterium M00.F.Ca.ET.230.01.1.1]VWX31367.1 molecular chaperone in protein export [Moraxellaceae bacterium 17A]GGL96432.1 protein-export protein SecB [Streptomyces cinereus]HBI49599.1 p
MADEQNLPQLALERIYVKDMSLEVPGADVFTREWQPELDINLSSAAEKLDDDHYQVILTVNVTANNGGETAFIAEVHQAGIFMLQNIPEEQLGAILGAYCPNVLFPYAREVVSDIVTRGSFPQLLLAPVNFDQAYQQTLEQGN